MKIRIDPNSKLDRWNIETIKTNIKNNGFNEERIITVDEHGWVLDGNHRYQASIELGIENEIPMIKISSTDFYEIVDELNKHYDEDSEDFDENYYSEIVNRGKKIQ